MLCGRHQLIAIYFVNILLVVFGPQVGIEGFGASLLGIVEARKFEVRAVSLYFLTPR